jgi:hypothetical protein
MQNHSKFKLNKELFATRCEVCHQSDLFDSFNQKCFRCKDILNQKSITDGFESHQRYNQKGKCRALWDLPKQIKLVLLAGFLSMVGKTLSTNEVLCIWIGFYIKHIFLSKIFFILIAIVVIAVIIRKYMYRQISID